MTAMMQPLRRLRTLLLGLPVALALAGCGQKGDLYLPEKTSVADFARTIPAPG
jgi:predicted small lipoprotein YifL